MTIRQYMMWRNRRRRGEGKKGQKDFAADVVRKFSTKLMVNRWQMLCPFPLQTIDIYRASFSTEQHRAMDMLMRTAPSMLKQGKTLNFIYDMNVDVMVMGRAPKPRYFKVTLDMNLPIPNTNTSYNGPEHKLLLSQLPPVLLEPIMDWSRKWLTACRETREVCGKLENLFDQCTTMGQIKRVWPNACNLLPPQAQAALREAKVRSPYSKAMLDHTYHEDGRDIWTLKEEWRPEVLAWYDERLTEALCLPMEDGDEDWNVEIEYEL